MPTASRKRVSLVAGAAGLAVAAAVFGPWGPAMAGHENAVLQTDLTGREEVAETPGIAGDPRGRGEAYVFGIDNDAATLCYVLTISSLRGTATAAHIHEGAAGTNGPVVAALASPADGDAADCLTEGEKGKFPTGEEGIVQRILQNPADFYVNVHSEAFPGGAVRGQLG